MLKIKQFIVTILLILSTITISSVTFAKEVVTREGKASWYGGYHHGRKTASGEVFDKNKLTAASIHLPFGTKVKITCMTTGKSAIVKVNDRGNFAKYGRTFDVSEGTAKALGFFNQGVTNIKYQILN